MNLPFTCSNQSDIWGSFFLSTRSIIQTEALPTSSLAKLYSLQKAASGSNIDQQGVKTEKINTTWKFQSLGCNSPSGNDLLGEQPGNIVHTLLSHFCICSQASFTCAHQCGVCDNSEVTFVIRIFHTRHLTWDLKFLLKSAVCSSLYFFLSLIMYITPTPNNERNAFSFLFFLNSHISVALIIFSPFPHLLW